MAELARNNDYKLGTIAESYMYDMLNRNNFSKMNPFFHLKSKLSRDTVKDPSVINSDINYHYNRLLAEKYAFITISETFEAYAAETCQIDALKEKGERISNGFLLQKNSAYARDFDAVLSRIQEGRLDMKFSRKFLPKPKQCSTSLSMVTLENFYGVFFIIWGGLSIALVALICEMLSKCTCVTDILELIKYVLTQSRRNTQNKINVTV